MAIIRNGGTITWHGLTHGNGLEFHYRALQDLLWPEMDWHRWREKQLHCFVNYKYIGEMGCAASAKTTSAAANHLADWYCFADCTTVLVSSTDLQSLDLRAWGAIKRLHTEAIDQFPWLPGYLIEGRRVIVLDERDERSEGRDFRNGLCAVPLKRGGAFVGLGPLIGVHNKRIKMLADELQLCPRAFLDSASNLSKCEDFKLTGLGNPNETTNAHGVLCEPASDLGGWESGIDQTPKTKTWRTRYPNGICLQLPGSDSPNMDVPEDQPVPYPYLMTRKQMEEDALIWGRDDWHFTMMNDARMPRGQGSRRVITRQLCEKSGALLDPIWNDTSIIKVGALDAAYRSVGGDRCVFVECRFGRLAYDQGSLPLLTAMAQVTNTPLPGKMIFALADTVIVPISGEIGAESPEDQIAKFCRKECEKRGILPENFMYDAGMRTSLVTAFARLWTPAVTSVDFGGSPTEEEVSAEIRIPANKYYFKFVTELWFSVRMCIESKQFRGLSKEAMWEFCAREWKHRPGTNKIEVETKQEMKEKSTRSPDIADAIVTALYCARKRGFRISRLGTPIVPAEQPEEDWRAKLREASRKAWRSGELEPTS